MARDAEQFALNVLSGNDRSVRASVLRAALALAEPAYAAAMLLRNLGYDRRILRISHLPRPTISVGNLTTGGTGKTPVVRWLAEQLLARSIRPAVLLRGYRATESGSDEQRMLEEHLPGVAVAADPDRVAAARTALDRAPETDLFILDDAFQHRRVHRDFDLVLISADEPFGFGHVIPRGLLREPVTGLRRADAIVLTRTEQVSREQLSALQQRITTLSRAPIYRAAHQHVGLRPELTLTELRRRRFFAFSGIGNVPALFQQLEMHGSTFVGRRAFPDHHAYTGFDLNEIQSVAQNAGAEMLVTTEKDWVKLRTLENLRAGLPIYRLELQVQFADSDADRLLEQILARVMKPAPVAAARVGDTSTPR